MILEVTLKFTLNVINKSLEISKVILKNVFKLCLRDRSDALIVALVLCTSKTDYVTKKWGGKQDTVNINGFWYFEIILILLAKIITIYIKLFYIDL